MKIPPKFFETLPRTIYFWLPVLSLVLGYGLVGRLFRVITVNGVNPLILLLLITLTVGSVWTLTLGNGGLLATVMALGLVFYNSGLSMGILAVAVAAVVMGLGFCQTDQERSPAPKLSFTEIAAVVVLVIWAFLVTLATYDFFAGVNAAVITGAIAGSYTVIGSQIKASEISLTETWQFFMIFALMGLAIGWVYGWFTYKVFILS